MSYRNPKIIDDKSGQVLGQAIAQGAQNISKGIMGMEAQYQAAQKRKEEKAKADQLKRDRDSDLMVDAIEKNAANRTAQYKRQQDLMKNVGKNFTDKMEKNVNEGGALRIANIQDKSPEMVAKIKKNAEEQENLNGFMVNVGSIMPEADELAGLTASELKNNAYYTAINGDDGGSAQLILKGLMATEGYGYDIMQEDGINYLLIDTPDGGQARFSESELQAAGSLFGKRDQTTSEYLDKSLKDKILVAQEGKTGLALAQGLSDINGDGTEISVPVVTEEIDAQGYKIVRQEINPDKLDQLLNTEIMRINATVTTAASATQRNLTLNDLLISPEDYNAASENERETMVGNQVRDNILQKYGIKQVGVKAANNAVITEYYRESRGPATKSDSVTSTQRLENYNDFNEGLESLITTAGDAPVGIKSAMELLSVGPGKKLTINSKRRPISSAVFNGDTMTVRWDNPKFDSSASDQSIEKYNYPDRDIRGLNGNPVKPAKNLNEKTFDLSNYVVLTNLIQDAGYVSASQAREMATNLQNANKARE
jgi:hypothetical protein